MLRHTAAPRRRPRTWSAPSGPWLAIAATALSVRVALAWWNTTHGGAPDAEANALLDTAARFAATTAPGDAPAAVVPWAPVPALVFASLARTGATALLAASIATAVTGALAALIVGALGGALMGSAVGVTAGWIVALDPFLVTASAGPSAAVPAGTVLLAATLASVGWLKDPRPARGLGAGLLWGLASLTHPAALPGAFVVAAWAWGPLGLLLEARARMARVSMLLLGMVGVVAPWSARVAFVHPAGAIPPLVAGAPPADATAGVMAFLWPAMPAPGRDAAAFLEARMPGLDQAQVIGVWWWLVAPLALWGLVTLARSPRRWFLSLPALCMLALGAMTLAGVPGAAARVAAEPLVALAAAVAWHDLRRRAQPPVARLRVVEGGRSEG